MVAFWLTPEYVVIPVTISHIETVIDYPEIFQLPLEQIMAVYRKYHEVLRTEGQARQEIIRTLISRGFVRLRRYRRPEYWSVNLSRINPISLELLRQFFWLIGQGTLGWRETDGQVPVILDSFDERQHILLQDLLGDYHPDPSPSRPCLKLLGADEPTAGTVGGTR